MEDQGSLPFGKSEEGQCFGNTYYVPPCTHYELSSCSDCQVFGDRSMRKPFSGLRGPEIAGFYLEAGSGAARRLSQKALA